MAETSTAQIEKRPMDSQAAEAVVSKLAAEDNVPWYQKPNLRMLYLIFIPTCLGVEMTSGFDSSMMNGLQAVASWQNFFNKPEGPILGVMSAIYSLGACATLPIVPTITDRFGRRFAIFLGSVIMIIGAILQMASQNLAMFLASRFILGMGIPFAIVAASSLIGELSHPKERAFMGSLFNACYFVGSITAAGVTLGTFSMQSTWGWRIPSILQVFPSAMQVIFVYFLPESPRWLISKGRGDEAFAILAKYHAEGNTESEFVKAEFVQIQQTLELELEHSKISWRQFVSTTGMRKRLLVGGALGLFTQWSGNGLTSYYLSPILTNVGVTDNRTKNLINLALTCWGFVNATFFAVTVARFPRRRIYLICTTSLLVVFTAWTVASARYDITKDQAASRAVIAMIFLYSPAYNIGYNALTYTFLVELFPFHARAKGITWFQWFGRGATFFNQFVNPIGLRDIGWKYYISYCAFLVFEVCFVWFLFPETANRTLEELTFLYEGDQMRDEQKKRFNQELAAEHKLEADKISVHEDDKKSKEA